MIRTILVPFDTSTKAGIAVDYASVIARAAGGRMILYSIIPDEALRHHAEYQLARATESAAQAGVSVLTRIENREGVAEAIIESARADEADLIAMGTSAWSDLDRWLHGSVADEVLRRAEVPVLIVPPQAAETVLVTRQGVGSQRQRAHTYASGWPGADEQPRILIALDGSDLAMRVLDPALALAEALKAELLLLRVVERPRWPPSGGDESATPAWAREPLREGQEYLDTLAATVSTERSVTTLAVVGDPPSAIAEAARTHGAQLIAMATHGRAGIARHLLGSVATATLQQATVPMLLVRPTGTAE